MPVFHHACSSLDRRDIASAAMGAAQKYRPRMSRYVYLFSAASLRPLACHFLMPFIVWAALLSGDARNAVAQSVSRVCPFLPGGEGGGGNGGRSIRPVAA